MKIGFSSEPVERFETPLLVVDCFESSASGGTVDQLPSATRQVLDDLRNGGELTGKPYECTLIHRPAGLKASRLLVVGMGKREKFAPPMLGRVVGTAARFARNKSIHDIALVTPAADRSSEALEHAAYGAVAADYDADKYRSERNSEKRLDRVTFLDAGKPFDGNEKAAVERGRILAEAAIVTRDLVNEPSNNLPPRELARHAQAVAARFGLECHVLGKDEILKKKMGALWAVAQGSVEEPRMIVLRYEPPQAPASPVIGLIGKGVTFDTGGISIKPADKMDEMKTDMAGGATMIGVMQAIAQLKPNVRVTAVIPSAENMPSGKSYRPGDVVTSMSGKTIEVLNTDAEGRLLLADGLAYARELGCTVLIDAATLTGAVMIALGSFVTGVFGTSQEWIERILASSKAVGEKMWQLPVDDEYRELYKSSIADIANTGGRYGGAITGAMFVGEFAGDLPWVHLDIAGTRWSTEEKPWLAKGPTGVPVRTLAHLVLHFGS